MSTVTFDTRNLQHVQFLPEWRGQQADCPTERRAHLPVLGNGGHRLEILRKFVYKTKLKVYHDVQQQIAKIDTTGKDKVEGHPHAMLIKVEIASNKNQVQVPENAQNSLASFFDALNAEPSVSADIIKKVMHTILNTDSKGQRVSNALTSVDLTCAYSRLCYNHYFRHDMPFSISALKRWLRVAGAYAIIYINWMALTFELLFSSHPLTEFPDITSNYDSYFSTEDSVGMLEEVRLNLYKFDKLQFSDKQVRFDILDDELYSCLAQANNLYKDRLDIFGLNHEQMTDSIKLQSQELFQTYVQTLYAGITTWLDKTKPKYLNDQTATAILHNFKNKCLWITAGQVGANYFHPAYDTCHPLVITEFLIPVCDVMIEHEESLVMIASQFEPLAESILTMTQYQPGAPTLYSLLWDIQTRQYPNAKPHEHIVAINIWLGTMFRSRFSGLEDIRRIHTEINRDGKNKPSYLEDTPKLTGPAGDDPILQGMDKVGNLLGAIMDMDNPNIKKGERKSVRDCWDALTSPNGDYVPTNCHVLRLALKKTLYTWKTSNIVKGSKSRTVMLRKLARSFWIASHAPYAVVGGSEEEDNMPAVYEGWDAVYFRKPRIAHMLHAMNGWHTWYILGPTDVVSGEDLTQDSLTSGFIEDLTIYRSMRSLDTQIMGANHTLKTVCDLFMKNPLFHCISTHPQTRQPVKTLKKPVAKVLQTLYEVCDEELGHTAKYLLQDEYDYDRDLSKQNLEKIHTQIVVLHRGFVTPSHDDLASWHSPDNMEVLNSTERHVDPDLARLENARLKRSKAGEKPVAGEKRVRAISGTKTVKSACLTAARLSKAPAKNEISATQQVRDEELIQRIKKLDDKEQGE
ncbi:hypothetical protein C0993_007102 [Termitomyces sp. T159_Od127]|nr:hypothetical protein C0993_007102 [Termitomyces sp. T159_Od127]